MRLHVPGSPASSWAGPRSWPSIARSWFAHPSGTSPLVSWSGQNRGDRGSRPCVDAPIACNPWREPVSRLLIGRPATGSRHSLPNCNLSYW